MNNKRKMKKKKKKKKAGLEASGTLLGQLGKMVGGGLGSGGAVLQYLAPRMQQFLRVCQLSQSATPGSLPQVLGLLVFSIM
jgi:hypothetical protein